MITCVTWLWHRPGGPAFSPLYVNRLRSMLERNLDLPHDLVLITDTPKAAREECDLRIRIVPMPLDHAHTPRCRRRMWGLAAERRHDLGARILALDLDLVILANITPLVNRPEPIVGYRVGHAGVLSGSFLLYDAGALDGAWRAFKAAPDAFPESTGERNASDQAMINHWLTTSGTKVAQWTERDGLITWYGGERYRRMQHFGMGPDRPNPPRGARVVVLGSADKHVLDGGRYEFVRQHWR